MHSGVIDSAVMCTAESWTPLWHAQWSHWHRCADMQILKCKYDTAVTFEYNLCRALATFKGNIYRKNIHRSIVLHYTYNLHTQKWGLTRDRWLRCDKNRRLLSRFSRRILIHIEKGINPCIRGLGGVVWWKNQRSKISCQGPFNDNSVRNVQKIPKIAESTNIRLYNL
jgi:hypothetical protein